MNSFRDFEKSLCILRDRACINILDPNQSSGANGILCYGYVDHAAGLTFEGLALVSCVDDDYTIVLDNDEIGMKMIHVTGKLTLREYKNRDQETRMSADVGILDWNYVGTKPKSDEHAGGAAPAGNSGSVNNEAYVEDAV